MSPSTDERDDLLSEILWLLDLAKCDEAERVKRVSSRLSLLHNEIRPSVLALSAFKLARGLAHEHLGEVEGERLWKDLLVWSTGGPTTAQAGLHSVTELLDRPDAARARLKALIEQQGAVNLVVEVAGMLRNLFAALHDRQPVDTVIEVCASWLVQQLFSTRREI